MLLFSIWRRRTCCKPMYSNSAIHSGPDITEVMTPPVIGQTLYSKWASNDICIRTKTPDRRSVNLYESTCTRNLIVWHAFLCMYFLVYSFFHWIEGSSVPRKYLYIQEARTCMILHQNLDASNLRNSLEQVSCTRSFFGVCQRYE